MKKFSFLLILVLIPAFVFAAANTSFSSTTDASGIGSPYVDVTFDLDSEENSTSYVGFISAAPKWNDNPTAPEESNVKFSLGLDTSSNTGKGDGYIYWILRGNNGVTINISASKNMKVMDADDSDNSKVLGWAPKIDSKSENGSNLVEAPSVAFNNKTVVVHKRDDLSKSLDYGYAKIDITTDPVADKAPENFSGTLTLTITKP